jgi:hypothetical protein
MHVSELANLVSVEGVEIHRELRMPLHHRGRLQVLVTSTGVLSGSLIIVITENLSAALFHMRVGNRSEDMAGGSVRQCAGDLTRDEYLLIFDAKF